MCSHSSLDHSSVKWILKRRHEQGFSLSFYLLEFYDLLRGHAPHADTEELDGNKCPPQIKFSLLPQFRHYNSSYLLNILPESLCLKWANSLCHYDRASKSCEVIVHSVELITFVNRFLHPEISGDIFQGMEKENHFFYIILDSTCPFLSSLSIFSLWHFYDGGRKKVNKFIYITN